jgi:hypothetical protein
LLKLTDHCLLFAVARVQICQTILMLLLLLL